MIVCCCLWLAVCLHVLQDVAEFTTTCERYVGTESGGMDQAISMMGMPQIAKLIEFNPVRAVVEWPTLFVIRHLPGAVCYASNPDPMSALCLL